MKNSCRFSFLGWIEGLHLINYFYLYDIEYLGCVLLLKEKIRSGTFFSVYNAEVLLGESRYSVIVKKYYGGSICICKFEDRELADILFEELTHMERELFWHYGYRSILWIIMLLSIVLALVSLLGMLNSVKINGVVPNPVLFSTVIKMLIALCVERIHWVSRFMKFKGCKMAEFYRKYIGD